MGNVLDSIVKHTFWEDEAINESTQSAYFDASGIEESYVVQATWVDGASVNMILALEGTLTPEDSDSWAELSGEDSQQPITTNANTHIWNVTLNAVPYVRVKVTVTAGSADFTAILSGKRRH